jgi:hypothetical protein
MLRYHRCTNNVIEGELFCGQHHPVNVKARQAKRSTPEARKKMRDRQLYRLALFNARLKRKGK